MQRNGKVNASACPDLTAEALDEESKELIRVRYKEDFEKFGYDKRI
jgi:hypothetical protein